MTVYVIVCILLPLIYSDPSLAKTLKELSPYRLDTLDACVLRGSCLVLQLSSCQLYLFTWSLTLIIIDKYDDMTLCPSPVVCVLCMAVTYSTHTDIKPVVKCWYDVLMTFSGRFLPRFARVTVEMGKNQNLLVMQISSHA